MKYLAPAHHPADRRSPPRASHPRRSVGVTSCKVRRRPRLLGDRAADCDVQMSRDRNISTDQQQVRRYYLGTVPDMEKHTGEETVDHKQTNR